jgi:hypothetical protein
MLKPYADRELDGGVNEKQKRKTSEIQLHIKPRRDAISTTCGIDTCHGTDGCPSDKLEKSKKSLTAGRDIDTFTH